MYHHTESQQQHQQQTLMRPASAQQSHHPMMVIKKQVAPVIHDNDGITTTLSRPPQGLPSSGAGSRNTTGFTTQNSTKNMNTGVNNSRLITDHSEHAQGIARQSPTYYQQSQVKPSPRMVQQP